MSRMEVTGIQGQPIIQLKGVSFRYPGSEQAALQDIDLVINRGEFVAVTGSNGSGKSTLCKCFNGLIPHYYVGEMEGSVLVDGIETTEQTVASISSKVAYVFQDFENQLLRPTVLDEASFAPLNFGYANYRERAERTLALLGLNELRNEWIWQLSGGQKHLTALAGVLSLDPEVIIVDEPAAQLDPARAVMIYEQLKILHEQYGKTIIVIEHHTEFVADYCSHMILMGPGGRLLWKKSVAAGLSEVELLSSLNIQPPQVTQTVYAAEQAHNAGEVTEQGKRTAAQAPRLYPTTLAEGYSYWSEKKICEMSEAGSGPPTSQRRSEAVIVELSHLYSGYQDLNREMKPVLQDLSLTFYEGERIAVVGNNGAGKSTLLKLLSGLRKPYAGDAHICGMNIRHTSPETIADQVAFIFQNPEEMFIEDNVRKDIEYYLRSRGRKAFEPFVDEIVERFRLQDLEQRDGRLLSGGQQRRASLAIGLAMQPQVLLLDEPTASLDIVSRKEMSLLLEELRDRVKLTIIATHDMQLVADWATRVIVMHGGQVILDADNRELFSRIDILQQAALIPPQIVRLSQELGLDPVCLTVQEFIARYVQSRRETMGKEHVHEICGA